MRMNLGVLCGFAYIFLLSIQLTLVWVEVRRQRNTLRNIDLRNLPNPTPWHRIVVVQPILSGDPMLSQVLQKNLRSLPPQVHFLWLIDHADKEAQRIANAILEVSMKEYPPDEATLDPSNPRVSILLCPTAETDINPKSFKLQLALEKVHREYFVVLDDDTMICPQTLSTTIDWLEFVDLYTGLPSYHRGVNLWSDLVAHFVNNNAVKTYLPPNVIFPPISINGMFYGVKTNTLRTMGGFRSIWHVLCDDHAIHQLFVQHGKIIKQGIARVEISTNLTGALAYMRLMHRWMVFASLLIRQQYWFIQVTLGILLGLPPILLWIALLQSGSNWHSLVFVTALLGLRQLIIALVQRVAFDQVLSTNWWRSLVAELVQPFQLVSALIWPMIVWREKRIRVDSPNAFRILQPNDTCSQ
ncbi:MAG: hypothetical protein KDB03_01915 [Planctomycetales bacterium]|nr:hypothetical protein [Planctomycetales bacterium]